MEWAELGLSGNPPAYEKAQLEEILKTIPGKIRTDKPAESNDLIHIAGILTSADVEKGKIKIRENGKRKYRTLNVPIEKIREIARRYIGEIVDIKASKSRGSGIAKYYKSCLMDI